MLVRDSGVGIPRNEMPDTILDLNSAAKLQTFEAIGQFGHGGSSSLAFCESALVISQPRFTPDRTYFAWTLVVPERAQGESKQELVRYWFCDQNDLPFLQAVEALPAVAEFLPGTAIWHFGYSRGGWIKAIAGPEQSNPWGRLGRLFFSYPLPFDVRGSLARTDVATGQRRLKGGYFRLLESGSKEYASGEQSESLILNGHKFGEFHAFVFVLKDSTALRDYVDPNHPIIATLNGQNHGEMTRTVLTKAGLPELSTSTIIELRLDSLDAEALSNIINNSREAFKRTEFTKALEASLVARLENDDALREIELARQERKAREASADMSERLSAFLSRILSDARGRPSSAAGSSAPGPKADPGPSPPPSPPPEIPAADPPRLLEFSSQSALSVPEGTTRTAKFRSDARPPKYSFHGDNPRLFVELRITSPIPQQLLMTGMADVNERGYGSLSVACLENSQRPIDAPTDVAELHLTLQSASGRTLHAMMPVRVHPKPPDRTRRQDPLVKVQITFSTAQLDETRDLQRLYAETSIVAMSEGLRKRAEALNVAFEDAPYSGDTTTRDGVSVLRVEINAGNTRLRQLMKDCRSAEEALAAKERYCQDVVLDCYQHLFRVEGVPEQVYEEIATASSPDAGVAAELFLNHDKAIRAAIVERDRDRGNDK